MTRVVRLATLGTATVAEAASGVRIVLAPLRPVAPGMRVAGPARTVRCLAGDNLALHLAINRAHPGDVIVADYGASTDSGPFGEIMALACQMRGIAGLVINGAVRDSQEIAKLGFPVFARGINIRGTTKLNRGEVDVPVEIGGVRIDPGDIMVADADAVIALPATMVDAALAASEARIAREAQMMQRLRAGETTLEILGLDREQPV